MKTAKLVKRSEVAAKSEEQAKQAPKAQGWSLSAAVTERQQATQKAKPAARAAFAALFTSAN